MSEHFDDDRDDDIDDDSPVQRNAIVKRSFDGVAQLMQNAATQALTAKATADINARWMIAMHRPRDLMDVRAAILRECQRPRFAAGAIYQVPRGGAQIRGLSIRFAEAVMKAMGNMGAEAQTLYDSDDERVIRVTVTDYEGNTAWSRDLTIRKTKEVKRRPDHFIGERLNSYGDPVWTVPATDDDVNVKEAAAISKASRTGILRLVPAWLLAECQEKCEQVQQNKAAQDPDAERRKIFDAFAQLNVQPSWIAEYLGHPVEQATPAEIVELQQLYRAIRDGQTTPVDALRGKRGEADKPGRSNGGAAAATTRRTRAPKVEQASGAPTPDEAAEIARLER
jgi:hypothetical protein